MKVLGSIMLTLLLLSACSYEDAQPPRGGIVVDTTWIGDTIVGF